MKNIVILNACGRNNMGDATICSVALQLIDRELKGESNIYGMFTDLKEDARQYKIKSNIENIGSPYGLAIANETGFIKTTTKIKRFFSIIIKSSILTVFEPVLPKKIYENSFYRYIKIIKESDAVIGMGGGYIRTKEKYNDYFGLVLTLLPIYIARFFRKPVLFLPISFGNFASPIHEKLAYNSIAKSTILCRDKISLNKLKKLDRRNYVKALFAPDLALFFNTKQSESVERKFNNDYIVLTAREWMDADKQTKYEQSLAELIKYAWKRYKLKTYFVAMAGNAVEDDDKRVAAKIDKLINNKKIFSLAKPKSPEQVQTLLDNAKIAVCTRMHSAIIASTVYTPFITIGYEYKTKGFMDNLNLQEWHFEIDEINTENLKTKFNNLLKKKNFTMFIKTLERKHQQFAAYKPLITKEIMRTVNK